MIYRKGTRAKHVLKHSSSGVQLSASVRQVSLAIIMCGQTRGLSLRVVGANIRAALSSLRNESDLFLAIDRTRCNQARAWTLLGPDTPILDERDIASILEPLAISVVNRSKGHDVSLMRGHQLMVQEERRRGTAYAWVMRLRPDMGFTLAFPPLGAWPKPKRPTLFADYISSGANDSACGPTATIQGSMMQGHGGCADDTFGFMNREVSNAYFRHWFWTASCGGTSEMPRRIIKKNETRRGVTRTVWKFNSPVGRDGRRGCMECRLGCAMHVANVRLAALPEVYRNRQIIRLPPARGRSNRSMAWLPLAGEEPKPSPAIKMYARSFQPRIKKSKEGKASPPLMTAQLWRFRNLVV